MYRVIYNNIGIYEALKKYLLENNKQDLWIELKNSDSFNWLKVPTLYNENCYSYFKELGFSIFKEKTLPIIKNILDERYIVVEKIDIDKINNNVIYEDEHQIVIEK